jgi:hypothetical protein
LRIKAQVKITLTLACSSVLNSTRIRLVSRIAADSLQPAQVIRLSSLKNTSNPVDLLSNNLFPGGFQGEGNE